MQIVVLGAGTVGMQIAQMLSDDNHQVVFIERRREKAMRIQSRIDCKVIIDRGTRKQVLQEANISSADYFVAATESDEVNLIACNIAKKISQNVKCIGRIRSKEYVQNYKELEEAFHVDYVVHPEREVAFSIIRSIEYGGGVSDVYTFENFGRVIMRNMVVPPNSVMQNVYLRDIVDVLHIPQNMRGKFLLALINRKNATIVPSGDTQIHEGDELFFIGEHNVLDMLFSHLGRRSKDAKDIKKIMIIGGGEVCVQLVDCYLNTQSNNLAQIIKKRRFATRDITVVDSDFERCNTLADMFHDITVLHADVSEENILEEIEISSFDMVIAVTESQERNIIIAAHSQKLGVKHTIALVESQFYLKIATELNIGYSLSIKNEVIESIRSYLSGQRSLYSIIREKSYEIFYCYVNKGSKITDMQIMDISLPENSILLCVNSKLEGTLIASGNTILHEGDMVLCFAPSNQIEKIRVLFGDNVSNASEVFSLYKKEKQD